MDIIYRSVCAVHPEGVDGVKWVMGGGYRYFSQLRAYFITVYENLVQHPSNNISIVIKPYFIRKIF